MSTSKSTGARPNSSLLGALGRAIPPSETLDRLNRFLSTYSGSDKALELIQCTLKLLVPLLLWRAGSQHAQGKRSAPGSEIATGFSKLSGIISDSRMLWRLFGLIPIIKWLSSLERSPPSNPRLRTIERLQAFSMLVYYPLEHMYYFGAQKVYPMSPQRLKSLSIWSTRAWLAYILLQFSHLREDAEGLRERGRLLRQQKRDRDRESDKIPPGGEDSLALEAKNIRKKGVSLKRDFLAHVAYFPQAIHWSLENGLFSNNVWLDVLGLYAAVLSAKNSWASTAQ